MITVKFIVNPEETHKAGVLITGATVVRKRRPS